MTSGVTQACNDHGNACREVIVDIYGLVASHLGPIRRPYAMDAMAEAQYYRDHATPLRPRLRSSFAVALFTALIAVATAASLF